MKRTVLLWIAFSVIGALAPATRGDDMAPDEPAFPPPGPPPEHMDAPPPGPGVMSPPGPGMRGGPMVDRWMEMQRRDDPREFDRLQRMREENPDAFRDELRGRIGRQVLERLQRDRPAVYAAYRQLPPPDREWLLERLQHFGPPQMGRRGMAWGAGPDKPGQRPGVDEENDAEIRKLAESYRASSDPAEKERLRKDLTSELNRRFDERTADRKRDLDDVEKRITQMKEGLRMREAHRDAIVEKRLKELTESADAAW